MPVKLCNTGKLHTFKVSCTKAQGDRRPAGRADGHTSLLLLLLLDARRRRKRGSGSCRLKRVDPRLGRALF